MSTHQAPMPLCQAGLSQLLIMDSQERLAAAMPKDVLAVAISNIRRLIHTADELQIPIITTEQYPTGLGPTIEAVRAQLPASAHPTEKTSFSSCTAAGFEKNITESPDRKQLVLMGMEAHIGIVQTASGLQRWGYQVFVVEDAICSRNSANRANALERMRHCGIQVTNTESVAFEWLGDSNHEKFRTVSKLFK